jgi:hypothetical protein
MTTRRTPKFTCTQHGVQANALVTYWRERNEQEVREKQWFMAALTLGCALEAMLYAYFIIWSGDDNNDPAKDEQISVRLDLNDLLAAAKQIDLLTPVKFKDEFGDHAVHDVVHEIRSLRNNIHAGVALRKSFDPTTFKRDNYLRISRIFDAVVLNFELAL